MDGVPVYGLPVMALDALGYRNPLVVFPVVMDMDVRMTLGTGYPFFSMNTGVMLGILLFVAALALNLLDIDLLFHMLEKIGNVHMAAGTGIFTMDGSGKRTD
jgi:hypothetical protein